jgi:hypothetical protein
VRLWLRTNKNTQFQNIKTIQNHSIRFRFQHSSQTKHQNSIKQNASQMKFAFGVTCRPETEMTLETKVLVAVPLSGMLIGCVLEKVRPVIPTSSVRHINTSIMRRDEKRWTLYFLTEQKQVQLTIKQGN